MVINIISLVNMTLSVWGEGVSQAWDYYVSPPWGEPKVRVTLLFPQDTCFYRND
ncbi:Uncharacterised protein [Serratia entomophila]|nr:Uncharacterised protein [Serratia entomophila]CAI1540731.1 Uncharacterised protein [Serratia entomophila]CAI1662593.1 Uncharacterised protein [Serratia entomophila]CAI1744099.1 Uncharacterised protein [Serratia entomophila]CAI1774584.1 Uncharacterised protein [Serratia entomophila]